MSIVYLLFGTLIIVSLKIHLHFEEAVSSDRNVWTVILVILKAAEIPVEFKIIAFKIVIVSCNFYVEHLKWMAVQMHSFI